MLPGPRSLSGTPLPPCPVQAPGSTILCRATPQGPMLPLPTGPAHFISNLKLKFPTLQNKRAAVTKSSPSGGQLSNNSPPIRRSPPSLRQGPHSHTDHAHQGNSVQTLSLFFPFVLEPFVGWHWKLPRWLTLNSILIFLGYSTVLSKHFLDCSITIHSVVNYISHCIVVVFTQAYLL